MSNFLYDPAFCSTERKDENPKVVFNDSKSSFFDFKSNRITRKGQLIQEESMLRRMKATSLVNKAHRESEIASMRIKYQLQELNFINDKDSNDKKKMSR